MAMPATRKTPDGRETRAVTTDLELRSAGEADAGHTATGYAILYGVKTNVLDLWTEEIAPGAFDKSLQTRDVIAIHSHDSGRIVGRKNAGTLTLRSDTKGMAFENPLPDTTDGRDLVVQIGRHDISGMSFGFRATKQEWDESVDPPHRVVLEGDLFEITYAGLPIYGDTEVALRSLEHAREERRGTTGCMSTVSARRMRLAQTERNI